MGDSSLESQVELTETQNLDQPPPKNLLKNGTKR